MTEVELKNIKYEKMGEEEEKIDDDNINIKIKTPDNQTREISVNKVETIENLIKIVIQKFLI